MTATDLDFLDWTATATVLRFSGLDCDCDCEPVTVAVEQLRYGHSCGLFARHWSIEGYKISMLLRFV